MSAELKQSSAKGTTPGMIPPRYHRLHIVNNLRYHEVVIYPGRWVGKWKKYENKVSTTYYSVGLVRSGATVGKEYLGITKPPLKCTGTGTL